MGRDMHLICYGEDGPAFDRRCPKCARFMKFPASMKWKQRPDDMCEFPKLECSRCGPVQPNHIGWGGDFR
jgi:hypothetical protein